MLAIADLLLGNPLARIAIDADVMKTLRSHVADDHAVSRIRQQWHDFYRVLVNDGSARISEFVSTYAPPRPQPKAAPEPPPSEPFIEAQRRLAEAHQERARRFASEDMAKAQKANDEIVERFRARKSVLPNG
jgi:hypothetical protein